MSRLVVSGVDAEDFLQGQLTCDMRDIGEEQLALGAWCNPKGRVITLFRLRRTGNGFAMVLPAELSDAVSKRLGMFRFRAKVEFELHASTPADLDIDAEYDAWAAEQIRAGIATIGLVQSEKFTPHMLNLDLLGAVSFDKGCYTGQEVVARTHYKGATRRRALRFAIDGTARAGDKIQLDGRDVGEVVNASGGEILAVVPVDERDADLRIGEQGLEPLPLPYLEL